MFIHLTQGYQVVVRTLLLDPNLSGAAVVNTQTLYIYHVVQKKK